MHKVPHCLDSASQKILWQSGRCSLTTQQEGCRPAFQLRRSPLSPVAAAWPCRRVLLNPAPLSKRFNFPYTNTEVCLCQLLFCIFMCKWKTSVFQKHTLVDFTQRKARFYSAPLRCSPRDYTLSDWWKNPHLFPEFKVLAAELCIMHNLQVIIFTFFIRFW